MRSLVREWVAKAEGDYFTARRERRARAHPNYDALCFHAQQCIEKYLKAWLLSRGIAFGRTHDLEQLLELARPDQTRWTLLRDPLLLLNQYAVEFRYPGDSARRSEALEAFKILERLRSELRRELRIR